MFKKIAVFVLVLSLSACVTTRDSKDKKGSKKVMAQSGVVIPEYGITIGVDYSPELDNLVKGYKVMTVAFTNSSINPVRLDPIKDSWTIKTAKGKSVRAVNSLAEKAPKVWHSLPQKVRDLMEYPLSVPSGYTQTFDVFVKSSVYPENFKSVSYFNSRSGMTFLLLNSD